MKTLSIFIALFSFAKGFAQDFFADPRDGKTYRTITVNNTVWMIDNLDFSSELSMDFERKLNEYKLKGRYYDLRELNQVVPDGWRIPNVQDWIALFQYLAEQTNNVELSVSTIEKPFHYTISNYNEKINLFEKGNQLNLTPTGRVEGGVFNIPDNYADFWVTDENEEEEGRSHIHIMNPWTTIHSHSHHLKTNQKKKLRKFMIRCVKIN